MSRIDVEEGPGGWYVMVADYAVMSLPCFHMAEFFARKLHQARESSQRGAMRILCEDFGMCDDVAKATYSKFFEDSRTTETRQ